MSYNRAMAKTQIRIDAAPREVFKVATDYESYPEFLDEVTSAEILEVTNRFVVVEFKVLMNRSYSYRLKYEETPYRRLKWSYLSGDFKDYSGSWELTPDGNGTLAVLERNFHIGRVAPKMLGRLLARASAGKIARRFKDRIESAHHLRGTSLDHLLQDFERRTVSTYLRRSDWDADETADMLSITKPRLAALIKKYDLKRGRG